MITVRLFGGLGNQMFQYAFAHRLALTHGTAVILDSGWFRYERPKTTPRRYELGAFALDESVSKRAYLPAGRRSQLPWRRSPRLQRVAERSSTFDKTALLAPDNVWLDGYWQSEKYFADAESSIRAAYRFKSRPSKRNSMLLDSIQGSDSVSLHVRRGDYLVDPQINKVHGTIPLDYYNAASERIAATAAAPHFYVFSDDPEWCKENIAPGYSTTYVSHNTGRLSFEDMRLMSHCRHHIISNSSFSWWGAWLGQGEDKLVIAPRAWFADRSRGTTDLLPESWVKL